MASMSEQEKARVASVGVAVPPFSVDQIDAGEQLTERFKDRLKPRSLALMKKVFAHPSIRRRHFAIKDSDSFFNEDPDSRIARFTQWSIELSAEAILDALADAGLTKDDV